MDEKPPKATKIWLITEYGSGFPGEWYPECGAVAWSPLPKLSPEQKRRLIAAKAAGVSTTQYQGDDNEN